MSSRATPIVPDGLALVVKGLHLVHGFANARVGRYIAQGSAVPLPGGLLGAPRAALSGGSWEALRLTLRDDKNGFERRFPPFQQRVVVLEASANGVCRRRTGGSSGSRGWTSTSSEGIAVTNGEQPSEQVNGSDVAQAFNFVLADNTRLNDRLDRLVRMLEREQVLRQQMQGQIERLTDRLALPSPEGGGSDVASRLEDTERQFGLLKRAVVQLVAFLEKSKQ